MVEKVLSEKQFCFMCEKEVLVDKKGYFQGIKDRHFYSKALCNDCSKVWDKYSELLDEDKKNFNEYANLIKNFIGKKRSHKTERSKE